MFAWKLGWIGYLVSNFDIIVVTVDGRGTGYRGERLVSNYQEYFKNPSKARFKRRTLHVPNLIIRLKVTTLFVLLSLLFDMLWATRNLLRSFGRGLIN